MSTQIHAPLAAPSRARRSGLRDFAERFVMQPVALVAAITLGLIVVAALAAPVLMPYDPDITNLRMSLRPPGTEGHLLGTDELGRDVLSRLLSGARVSLLAALQGTGLSLAIGVPLGLIAGYFAGRVDRVIMFFNDALMSFPAMLLAMAIAGILKPSLTNAMIAIGIITAPRALRLVRASTLTVREATYIEAARSIGAGHGAIIWRHVLPNVMAPLIVLAMILAGTVMLMEAGLSFLGLGVQSPQSSWGSMLGGAFNQVTRAPWLATFPGICIAVTVLALNLVGDGMRDAFGKKTRG